MSNERMAGKFGMSHFQPRDIKLLASSYLDVSKLPLLPKAFGHFSNKPPGGGEWGWFGNQKYSTCVVAGWAHEEMAWAAASGRLVPKFSEGSIVSQYMKLTGGKDEGLDPVVAANWRRSFGLVDDNGVAHKIKAYTLIDSPIELDYSAYLFGAAGLGLMLPDNATRQFDKGQIWDDISGIPKNGHYVVYLGRNSHGNRVVATWNEIQAMTDQYLKRYMIAGLCYFSPNYLLPSGVSPEAINEAQLDADLRIIPSIPHRSA